MEQSGKNERAYRSRVRQRQAEETRQRILTAARDFFDRYNRESNRTLSVIGSHAQNVI